MLAWPVTNFRPFCEGSIVTKQFLLLEGLAFEIKPLFSTETCQKTEALSIEKAFWSQQ